VDFQSTGIYTSFCPLAGFWGHKTLNRAAQANFSAEALSGPPRVSRTALVGALTLIALSGCNKGQSSPNETKVVAGETYEEFDKRRDTPDGSHGDFEGQGCTQDCGGHEAGYAWAEEKGITDPDHCGGKSWSFIEGCKAYAEQASAEGE
jgi:hypothetical protein